MVTFCSCNHFLTDLEVASRYSISRPTIWRWAKAGKFPKPKKLNGSARWKLEDLEVWEENLPESSGELVEEEFLTYEEK